MSVIPNVTLPLSLDPIIQWAVWGFDQIDQALYLIVGTSFAFVVARGLMKIFGTR